MKKPLILLLCTLLLVCLFSGCAANAPAAADDGSKKLSVVTTIFPQYDWVRQIVGEDNEHVSLTMLLDNGVDLHSYQPTADDILTISTCDLFIYVGGMSDAWVEAALSEAVNPNMVVVNLLEALGDAVKEEELVEGMEGEEEEEDEGPEYDEHVWLSVKNAEILCGILSDKLCALDPDHKDDFAANAAAYLAKLDALDQRFQAAVDAGGTKTILFGDRFPFRYLTDDYGLRYYAAFVGCSAETEASFETVIFLANKVDELGLNCILQIESSDGRLSETIRQTTQTKDQQILTMNSLQSTTALDLKNGVTYLSLMEENLAVLEQAVK